MISLKQIIKTYHLSKTNEVSVLKGVDLTFRKHEFVSVLGPSGCGKTTLLNIIGGLDVCDSGEIIVGGVSTAEFSTSDWDNYRNKRIGFVFQSYNLIPHLNVVRNVSMPLVLAGEKKSDAKKKAIEILKKVGLEEQIYKKPLQLSGGQMQRVALARALVTDPDIILADEPTGALDAESSVQVMELLRQVANDRLVIMVTHNNELAEKYSTRIISLAGGVVSRDTHPYDGEDEVAPPKTNVPAPVKEKKKKAHLSFGTAAELSARTLVSKKVRTALTAFAGSIGIIGIVLVLAVSTGVNAYITNLEKGALAMYPIKIEQTSIDISSVMEKLSGANGELREDYPSGDTIYTNTIIGNILPELTSGNLLSSNDLTGFKKYADESFNDDWGYIKYEYGVPLNVYAPDSKSETTLMKTEPFTDVMEQALSTMGSEMGIMAGISNGLIDMIKPYAGIMSAWDEMMDNTELLHTQYDLVGNSRWPVNEVYQENGQAVAEVVVVVDEKNQLNDYSLFMLGLKSETEVWQAIFDQTNALAGTTYKVSDIIGKEYYILGGYDYYYMEDGAWNRKPRTEQSKDYIMSHYSVKAKVVGVIRPSKKAAGKTINGAIGYHSSLMHYLIENAEKSEIVQAQKAAITYSESGAFNQATNVLTGEKIQSQTGEGGLSEVLLNMGVADLSKPMSIEIYSNSFESKEKIKTFIQQYNSGDKKKTIQYSDTISTIMSFVNTMSTAITSVLIGFTSISLIVSSIMIAVIIYTSVLERRKEVGILRSIGARKRDIVMIFMTESGMLGLGAGLLGVFIGYLLTLPINALLIATVGIPNLAIVEWWHALAMVAISFGLSIAAGVVPAFIGAKQDPAVALRTE